MQHSSFTSRFARWLSHAGGLLVVLVIGCVGASTIGTSSATTASYSHNPTAITDYCTLEGSSTVLYGWAYDPDSPAGPLPNVSVNVGSNAAVTVASSIPGYRDAQINSYINSNYPGAPTNNTYGWRLVITGLYKGTTNVVSGTGINYGPGANVALQVNTSHSINGQAYFTGNNAIPDSCLLTRPTPAPSPPSTPTPTPAPVKKRGKAPVTAAAPTAPTVSNAADATVVAGTTRAVFTIPSGNASSTYILYGTDPAQLNRSSDIQTLAGPTAEVTLDKLDAKTTYTYQVVRTLGTQTVNSANATFTTNGYSLSLLFTDKDGKPVKGINGELGDKKLTSDDSGRLTFTNLASGAYSPIFTYNGQSYSQDFNTSSAAAEDGTNGVVLSQTINVANLATHKTTAKPITTAKKSPLLTIGLIILGVASVGGILFWFIRRRRESESYLAPPPVPMAAPVVIDLSTAQTPGQPQPLAPTPQQSYQTPPMPPVVALPPPNDGKAPFPPTPTPAHMGESLRDMVLQSMAEEAKHPHPGPKPPVVPGRG